MEVVRACRVPTATGSAVELRHSFDLEIPPELRCHQHRLLYLRHRVLSGEQSEWPDAEGWRVVGTSESTTADSAS